MGVLRHRSTCGGSFTIDHLIEHVRRFPTNRFLRCCGLLSDELFRRSDAPFLHVSGVPITQAALAYLALLSILRSNDHRGRPPEVGGVVRGVDIYHGLPDPVLALDGLDEAERELAKREYVLRQGQRQFEFQRDVQYLLARTLTLFEHLWPTIPEAQGLDPSNELRGLAGLSVAEAVAHGFLVFSQSREGSYRALGDAWDVTDLPAVANIVTPESEAQFLRWVGCDYAIIHELSKSRELPSEAYETSRLNPLLRFPIVRPREPLQRRGDGIHIVPVPRLVYERVTRGLYQDLFNARAQPRGANAFKVAFGSVLEAYIRLLLAKAQLPGQILGEQIYANGDKSPDWFVLHGDSAVVVEVKQAGLYLDSKLWGRTEDTARDAGRSIGKALKQVERFHAALASQDKGLHRFEATERFEHLVVTFDRVYGANSTVRDIVHEVRATGAPAGKAPHIHVVSVEELEYLLSYAKPDGLFGLLQRKREDDLTDRMDFHEWMAAQAKPPGGHRNAFLDSVYLETRRAWGI